MGMYLCMGCWCPWLCWSWDLQGPWAQACSQRARWEPEGTGTHCSQYCFLLSPFSPGSSDKIDKRNDKMQRRGSSNRGRRNFETWKTPPAQPSPAQPRPTEKQKLDVVSHSALLSSSPGTPVGPQKQPSSRRALRRGLGGAVHQQPSRKKHAKWILVK